MTQGSDITRVDEDIIIQKARGYVNLRGSFGTCLWIQNTGEILLINPSRDQFIS